MLKEVTSFTSSNSDIVVKFNNVSRIIDPITVQVNDGSGDKFYSMSKIAASRLLECLGMRSLQFNKQLFELSPDVWKSLLELSLNKTDEKDWRLFEGLVFNNQIASITAGDPNYQKVIDILQSSVENGSKSYYSIDDEVLYLYSFSKSDLYSGILIRYYFEYNWITVNYVYKNDRELVVFNFKEFDGEVDDDLDNLVHPAIYLENARDLSDNMLVSYRDLADKPVSVNEMYKLMKKIFKIKLTLDQFNVYDYLSEKGNWIPEHDADRFIKIIDRFYANDDTREMLQSSWLKKSVNFTDIKWGEIINLLSPLAWNNLVSFKDFLEVESNLLDSNINYCQLHY